MRLFLRKLSNEIDNLRILPRAKYIYPTLESEPKNYFFRASYLFLISIENKFYSFLSILSQSHFRFLANTFLLNFAR